MLKEFTATGATVPVQPDEINEQRNFNRRMSYLLVGVTVAWITLLAIGVAGIVM